MINREYFNRRTYYMNLCKSMFNMKTLTPSMCIQMHRIAMNGCQKIMMYMVIKMNKILFRRKLLIT